MASIDERGISVGAACIEASTVLWTAGVRAPELAARLGVPLDRSGRVLVSPDCSVPGHPEVLVIGDMANLAGADGTPLPGLAPVAMQQGRYVARVIKSRLTGEAVNPFSYDD